MSEQSEIWFKVAMAYGKLEGSSRIVSIGELDVHVEKHLGILIVKTKDWSYRLRYDGEPGKWSGINTGSQRAFDRDTVYVKLLDAPADEISVRVG